MSFLAQISSILHQTEHRSTLVSNARAVNTALRWFAMLVLSTCINLRQNLTQETRKNTCWSLFYKFSDCVSPALDAPYVSHIAETKTLWAVAAQN